MPPEGRQLIDALGQHHGKVAPLMDRAYQDDATRQLPQTHGRGPIVPPHPQRKRLWKYDKQLYKQRNGIERLFRRLKAWRRVFTRYNKLDIMSAGSITIVLIAETLR